MATSYGSWQNSSRVWFDYSVGSISQSSTHVSVTAKAYVQVDQYAYSNGTWTQSWNGWWAGSISPYWNLSPNQSALITTQSASVPLSDSPSSIYFTATGRTFYGASSHSIHIPIPARYARTPTDLTGTRVSDTLIDLNWTRNSTYTAVVVQRSADGASDWSQVGRPTGNANSFSDTSVVADSRYYYRVAGVGGSGQSPWSSVVGPLYTSPAAPTGVSATRVSNTEIVVSAAGTPPFATAYDIEDNGSVIATGVLLPWSHMNPPLVEVHQYRVRGVIGSLTGDWSAQSNTVQLLTRPNQPMNLSPNGVTREAGTQRVSWTHNPVDTTAQTAAEVQYRKVGDPTWWGTASATTQNYVDLDLSTPTNYEWRVRTKGEYNDTNPFSDWSAVATLRTITAPGAAILSPTDPWGEPLIRAQWSYFQLESLPQTAWQLELLNSDHEAIETRSGSGPTTQLTLTTRIKHNETMTLRVRVASGEAWSAWAAQEFTAVFVAPAPASVTSEWNEEEGSMGITLMEGRGPVIPDITNYAPPIVGDGTYAEVAENLFTNPNLVGDGTWAEVRRNLETDPSFEGSQVWSQQGVSATRSTEWASTGEKSMRLEGNGAGNNSTVYRPLSSWGVETGKTYTAMVKVHLPSPLTGPLNQSALSFSLNSVGFPGAYAENAAGTQELRFTFTVDGTVNSPTTLLRLYHGAAEGNGVSYWDDLLIVEGEYSGGFFDGSTTPETAVGVEQPEDFRWRWLGTPNASEAVLEIERVAGLTAANCIAGVSTRDGKPAVRLIPNAATSSSYISLPRGYGDGQMTQIGTVHTEQPLTGTLNNYSRVPRFSGQPTGTQPASPPNIPGAYALRNLFDGNLGALPQFWHGGAQGSGDVWWTNIGLFAGDYRFPWKGSPDDLSGITQPEDFRTRWLGTPNESESVLEIERVEHYRSLDVISGLSQINGKPAIRQIMKGGGSGGTVGTVLDIPSNVRPHGTVLGTAHIQEALDNHQIYSRSLIVQSPQQNTFYDDVNTPDSSVSKRLEFSDLTSGFTVRFTGGSRATEGHVWWTDIGLFEGDYDGPWFDGDTGLVRVNGSLMQTNWNGVPGSSTSTASMVPEAITMSIERSVDGGKTWTMWLENISTVDGEVNVTDWESLACGETLYKVTSYAVSGASTELIHAAYSDSESIFFGGGSSFSQTARLPNDPTIKLSKGRQRLVEEYAGRSLGVAYSSRRLSRSVAFSGTVFDHAEGEASKQDLEDIAELLEPVFLYRDFHGNHLYGSPSDVDFQRTGRRIKCDDGCMNGIWVYSISMKGSSRS